MSGRKPKPIAERLMAKILKSDNGCWLWQGDKNSHGYGRLGEGGGAPQKLLLAHRVSHQCFVGPIPKGIFVLHRCDVPACVNPEHLFLGTLSDNTQDSLSKGRHVAQHGEKNPTAKLTRESAAAIRANPFNKSVSEMAREYGVSRRAIRFVIKGETWK